MLVSPDLLLREPKTITQFIAFVKLNTGLSLSITHSEDPNDQLIVLRSNQLGSALPVPGEKSDNQSREAYQISVTSNRVQITAKSDANLFYALQTLRQLIVGEDKNSFIPEVDIADYPTFAFRGIMMDFSHGGLLSEAEIKKQIDFLARWKINQYYFYNEVSIEMKGYPLINYNACYSQAQIKRIIAYARERHMDVIPFVNFYGHLHEMLRLEKYVDLGIGEYGHELNPNNPEVKIVLKDWIRQYVDIFPSLYIHVGFDETWETERLKKEDQSIKPKELYFKQLDYVTKILQEYGKTVMVWTDISSNYPDIISEFPKDLVPVIWEYSNRPNTFAKWVNPIKKEKLPFFVQSAVDSWGSIYPNADYTFENIDLCLKTCRDENAIGYITSVWTDAVQPLLRNTWLFMAYGSVGGWQKEPMERSTFTHDFCQIMYPEIISSQMCTGFEKMAEAQSFLGKSLRRHTLQEMWTDPFSSHHLENTKIHIDDYKNARLAAEMAQENFIEALQFQTGDTAFIKTMLVNCRQLDYVASRYIWAKTIVDRWNWSFDIKSKGEKDNFKFYDINNACHGLTVDMMDYCTEIRKEYREAWLSENMSYRMGTIIGKFDSEYLLWRSISTNITDYQHYNRYYGLKFEDVFLNR